MKYPQPLLIVVAMQVGLLSLTACSSDGEFAEPEYSQQTPYEGGTPPGALEDEASKFHIPEGTNLRIEYADARDLDNASPSYVLNQWTGMKGCLQVDVPDGQILIERIVTPPADANDVIQMPDQSFAASALDRDNDVLIQIISDDFDPEVEDRGYFFRQIIGSYMWRYNGRDERTYDPYCAAYVVR
ncbi:MAG TPA: hypothetical protein DD979_15135 [Gammaproteobacteria bacterium]|nr:hypothetical protein [Gammaproteobacteria bacterium]